MSYKMTQADYAKHRGISPARVSRYVNEGKLKGATRKKSGRTYIDPDKADAALKRNLDQMNPVKNKHARFNEFDDEQSDEKEKLIQEAGNRGVDYQTARTFNEQYKAALRKLEYEHRSGKLVSAEEVKTAAFNKARKVRDAILNVPDRIGPVLAAEKRLNKVLDILTRELQQALEELSER